MQDRSSNAAVRWAVRSASIRAWLSIGCLSLFTTQLESQRSGRAPVVAAADSAEIGVLRDILSAHGETSGWKGEHGRLCLDPNVARYEVPAGSAPSSRWSPEVLRELLRNPVVAIDSATGPVPTGSPACARSQKSARLAYGRPRIAGDSGAVVFVASRLDRRGQADTFKFDYQLKRDKGTWTVERWLADSQTTHTYVRGEGCYRFSHSRFSGEPASIRIDTVLVRAEAPLVGTSWNTYPAHRLMPGAMAVRIGGNPGGEYWYVTHDSLHLYWSGVNSFLYVDLLVMGDSLRGSMHWESDYVVPNPPRVAVVGHRAPCTQ